MGKLLISTRSLGVCDCDCAFSVSRHTERGVEKKGDRSEQRTSISTFARTYTPFYVCCFSFVLYFTVFLVHMCIGWASMRMSNQFRLDGVQWVNDTHESQSSRCAYTYIFPRSTCSHNHSHCCCIRLQFDLVNAAAPFISRRREQIPRKVFFSLSFFV